MKKDTHDKKGKKKLSAASMRRRKTSVHMYNIICLINEQRETYTFKLFYLVECFFLSHYSLVSLDRCIYWFDKYLTISFFFICFIPCVCLYIFFCCYLFLISIYVFFFLLLRIWFDMSATSIILCTIYYDGSCLFSSNIFFVLSLIYKVFWIEKK